MQSESLYWDRIGDMLIQRTAGQVVLFPAGLHIGHRQVHMVEKYSKFAYSSRHGFSVPRSGRTLEELAPDSTLVFCVHGNYYVRGTIRNWKVESDRIWSEWSPYKGIDVLTWVIPFVGGHQRIHTITSEYDCIAYDCGFAVPPEPDPQWRLRCCGEGRQIGNSLWITAEPNTNLIWPRTKIPAVSYDIKVGSQTIRSNFYY